MIKRVLQAHVADVAGRYPVVTLTGPRQSGKTTLCRATFPDKPYVSLETPSERDFALLDPVGFLARYPQGVILDEIQRASDLPSYLQSMIDDDPRPGRFILTGSQNLAVMQSVSQSLAGRTALLQLFPLALEELRLFESAPSNLFDVIWTGGYPRILDRHLPAAEWLASYSAAYVERDVRQILNIGDLLSFQTFLRLSAGRVGQLLNLSSLGNDCGVTHMTAKSWISALEASFLVFRLPPFHRSLGKRLVKSPKLYFHDTGLLCHLLGIEKAAQLATHPLRGAIFENWVIAEVAKYWTNRGRVPSMFFYRDQRGHEIDLVIEQGERWTAVEIKSAATPSTHFYDGLDAFVALARQGGLADPPRIELLVVYGGSETQQRSKGTLLSWSEIDSYSWLG